MLPDLLTPNMVNVYFKKNTGKGLARAKLYALFNSKDFPSFKIGKRMFVRSDRLAEWMDTQSDVK